MSDTPQPSTEAARAPAAVVSVIPVLLTFFASQRWFTKGLAADRVTG